ncbi:CGNR zinc finger domain-containing protein [Nioella nitratireducens]|uniref:CGNR zinc finger domain-containing protein n=1 Tax=Nioella nitratireducens TaxID=1287720 RepID=UPI0008FD8B02|nr:ABATE domain-containing protein [Nioella nitratireducens]
MTTSATRADPGAGHPFLVFLNTVTDDGKSRRHNSFETGAEVIALLEAEGFAAPPTPLTQEQMHNLLTLRETAYAALSAVAAGRAPGREDALYLTQALKAAYQEAELRIDTDGLTFAPSPLGRLYEQLVLSMHDLLRSREFARLRECRRCSHLFFDKGRGVGRRWCSMARCGNRAKAETFRARHRDAA